MKSESGFVRLHAPLSYTHAHEHTRITDTQTHTHVCVCDGSTNHRAEPVYTPHQLSAEPNLKINLKSRQEGGNYSAGAAANTTKHSSSLPDPSTKAHLFLCFYFYFEKLRKYKCIWSCRSPPPQPPSSHRFTPRCRFGRSRQHFVRALRRLLRLLFICFIDVRAEEEVALAAPSAISAPTLFCVRVRFVISLRGCALLVSATSSERPSCELTAGVSAGTTHRQTERHTCETSEGEKKNKEREEGRLLRAERVSAPSSTTTFINRHKTYQKKNIQFAVYVLAPKLARRQNPRKTIKKMCTNNEKYYKRLPLHKNYTFGVTRK